MRAGYWVLAALLAAIAAADGHAARDKERPIAASPGPHPAGVIRGIVTIPNGGFEEALRYGEPCPERWNCVVHADPTSFSFRIAGFGIASEGKQSLCVHRITPEPWALVTQMIQAHPMRNGRARVSVAVRIDADTAQEATGGPWVMVRGPLGILVADERQVGNTAGWQRLSVEVPVAANAETIEVGASMYGGGRACFDDVRLEILP